MSDRRKDKIQFALDATEGSIAFYKSRNVKIWDCLCDYSQCQGFQMWHTCHLQTPTTARHLMSWESEMGFKKGDRVQVRSNVDHWSAGEFGTVIGITENFWNISVRLDCEGRTEYIGYRSTELDKI